jgi:hypothetical protein
MAEKERLFTPEQTKAFAAALDGATLVSRVTIDEHGPALAEELRALNKPLLSADGVTYRAYQLCAGCGHDSHPGAGTCTGFAARPEAKFAVGSRCLCESTP